MIGNIIDEIKNIFGCNKDKGGTNFAYPKFGCIPDETDLRDMIYEVRRDIKLAYYRDRYENDEEYREMINQMYNQ